jgi:hypothetical protein
MTLQFRFETYNTFNHTQFFSTSINSNYQVAGLSNLQDPTKPFDATTNPGTDHFTGCSTGTFPNCNTNAAFGLPTKARDPRELQLALKLSF